MTYGVQLIIILNKLNVDRSSIIHYSRCTTKSKIYDLIVILETAKGNTGRSNNARQKLERINVWLDANYEDDIGFMWTLIDEKIC